MAISDSDRINFLETLHKSTKWTGFCKLRLSGTGRGWRLHEHSHGATNVRDAIDFFILDNSEMFKNSIKSPKTP